MELTHPNPNALGAGCLGSPAVRLRPEPYGLRPIGFPSSALRARLAPCAARSACGQPRIGKPREAARRRARGPSPCDKARFTRGQCWLVASKGRSARATAPNRSIPFSFPVFSRLPFRVNVIRFGVFASGFRGINRVCRHPVVTSFPRVLQQLFIPRPHLSVSSLRSPLRFAKTPNRIPLFTRQTRKNWAGI